MQLSCWTYEYKMQNKDSEGKENGSSPISREMCLVMNELIRIITGMEDDWWK